jgi:hypothetical protein
MGNFVPVTVYELHNISACIHAADQHGKLRHDMLGLVTAGHRLGLVLGVKLLPVADKELRQVIRNDKLLYW